MSAYLTRAAALWQAVLAPSPANNVATQNEASSSGAALHTSPLSVIKTEPLDYQSPIGYWRPNRPDALDCAYYGENGCWEPSEPSEGPPYNHDGKWPSRSKLCVIQPCNDPEGDDAPSILKAFHYCKHDGHIIFQNATYYIRSVMDTTGLKDVDVEVLGTLLWSTDIDYWLANSLPVGFQNQTSAWYFGGENVHFYGHGFGTLHGNGQAWYDFNQGVSNRHGRPHAITIAESKNMVVEGLRFIKSQMWTMTVARSEKLLLQDIYVNNTSDAGRDFRANVNTDGCDTVYANNITFLRWTVDNGDDAITMKQNSTNIYIGNCTFYHGESIAMGSIGQYPGQIEVIENVTAENIIVHGSGYAARVKTWTGMNKGFPPNGGGGGIGRAKNITFRNFELDRVGQAWAITQCTSYNGQRGDCDTSEFQVQDLYWGNTTGTITGSNVATLQCSKNAPCSGVTLMNNHLTIADREDTAAEYLCDNVVDPDGFDCTAPCNGRCPR